MAQLSVSETTTFRWSFEEDVANYARAGIPAMGVWRQKLSDFGEVKGIELLAQSGVKASHLLWAGGFTGSDGRSFRVSIEDAVEALKTAAELHAQCLIVYSGVRAGHTVNHARRLLRDALKELAPIAAEQGVVLAVEPMHSACGGQFTFLHTAAETLDLLAAVGSPHVKMVFDTYHLGFDPDTVAIIPEIAHQVALVQLGDAARPPCGEQARCLLGEGVLPLADIVASFRASGYDGYFDVELLGEDLEHVEYDRLLAHAKEAYQRLVGHP
jgi:sugar phosphate isomerase/epimerase